MRDHGRHTEICCKDKEFVNYKTFFQKLQQELKIWENINEILYSAQSDNQKFILNEATKKQELNPECLRKVHEYTLIKNLVNDLTNEDASQINVVLLKQLVTSIFAKYRMLYIKRRCNEIKLSGSDEDVL